MDSSPPVPQEVLLIVGPILVGTMISYLLLGIVFVQVYFYYMSFPNDRLVIKISVYSLFLLDIFQTIAISSTAWSFLCAGWGRQENLHLTDWGFALIPMFDGVCSAIVQVFFAWRIYSLGMQMPEKKIFWVMIVSIIGVSLAQAIASMVATIRWYFINDLLQIHRLFTVGAVWLAGSAICDVLITVCMIYLLNTARTKTRQPHFHGQARPTELLLSRLIRNSMETGAITSGAAVLDLIFFLHFSDNSLHLSFALILSKLYTNTLYASLNARTSFRRDADKDLSAGAHSTVSRSAEIVDSSFPSHSFNTRHVFSPTRTNTSIISFNQQHTDRVVVNKSSDRTRHLDDEQNMIPMVSIVKETFHE
ncbi:hypothetical protein K435DRAFT_844132 [Dendrothele bispora CBS 962.96]|uniref:DUF6534 domain-containing protein n=1 Tax=Dendrothele bispora (strain CBS 962.96) TaxID=1314807 RepID=A0A4S8L3S5_DENBC|nr:hypothetical protein K435DRAFT_844132 [Dendrothele bispora CBS 962.96]